MLWEPWGLEIEDTLENISAQSAKVIEKEIATHRDNRHWPRLHVEDYG